MAATVGMTAGLLAGFLLTTWPLVRMAWHALHHEGDLAWLLNRP